MPLTLIVMPLTLTAVAAGDAYLVGAEDAVMPADLAYRASTLADCCASVSRSGIVRTYRVSLHFAHLAVLRYRVQLSSHHAHSGHSSASDGNDRCSDFTFPYTVRARSSAAPGRPIPDKQQVLVGVAAAFVQSE